MFKISPTSVIEMSDSSSNSPFLKTKFEIHTLKELKDNEVIFAAVQGLRFNKNNSKIRTSDE